jgi:hypothetical protein
MSRLAALQVGDELAKVVDCVLSGGGPLARSSGWIIVRNEVTSFRISLMKWGSPISRRGIVSVMAKLWPLLAIEYRACLVAVDPDGLERAERAKALVNVDEMGDVVDGFRTLPGADPT